MLTILFSTVEWFLRPVYQSYQTQAYFGMILYVLFAIILCGILAAAAYLFSLSALQDSEKRSEYECGFEPFDSATRLPFDVHFYLVGILFLIFDVEIALLFPWVLGLRTSGWFGFYIMLGFIILLAIGFLYEWKRGALIWPSRQLELPYNSGMTNVSSILFYGMVDFSGIDLVAVSSNLSTNLLSILPEVVFMVLISYLLTVLALELGQGRSKKDLALESLAALRVGLLCVAFLYFLQLAYNHTGSAFSGYFLVNSYTTTFKLLTLLSGLFVLHNSDEYIRRHERHLLEYPIVLSLALLLMLLLVSAGHLISAFLALVGFSLNIYVLILFDAPTAVAREAGIKYFYLSAFSSGLFIYGIFLFFLVTGTGHFYEIATLMTYAEEIQGTGLELLQLAVVFILTGLFFKLSAFPGHLWAADVYEGSPDPVMAFFMLPAKVSVFSFVMNFLVSALEPLTVLWQPIIAFSAIGSLIWGCFAALAESKTKRFLAYASINQMGFLLLGVATNSHEGTRATILYIFLYVIMNMIFLTVYLHAGTSRNAPLRYLTDFRTLANTRWTYTWSLAIALLSMAGIPPLAGFFGKYYLLLHAQEQGLYGLVVVALVTSLVSTYYYLRLIKIFWFEGKDNAPVVQCTLSISNQSLLFIAECCLWVFIFIAGPVLAGVDSVATNLAIISPHAASALTIWFF